MKIRRYLYFILVSGLFLGVLFFKNLEKKPIDQIDLSDRQDIEIFFRTLVYESHIGYTLFGDKPVSIEGYFIQEPSCHLALWKSSSKMSMNNLWKTWEKYQSKLKIKNYIILNEANPAAENLRTITVINKQAFLAKVCEHLDDFQDVLGKNMTPEKLLAQLTLPHASLYETLQRNEILYGILLGFGKENAKYFLKRFKLSQTIDSETHLDKHPYESYSLRWSLSHSSLYHLKEELSSLEKSLFFFGWNSQFCPIQSPRFIAIKDNPETLALQEQYRELQHKLLKIYSEGDFLTITLDRLCR